MKCALRVGVVAVVAIAALIMLFYFAGNWSATGAVSTGICPPGSAPVIAEGVWAKELQWYQRLGHKCFFGYDGITPCCSRTENCCLPFDEWRLSPSVGTSEH